MDGKLLLQLKKKQFQLLSRKYPRMKWSLSSFFSIITLLPILFGWLLWWSSQKEYHLAPSLIFNSLFVSNFSIGTAGLIGTWDTKFIIKNNSIFSKVRLRSIDITITFQENPLTDTGLNGVLDEGQTKMLRMRFINRARAGWRPNEPYFENELLDEISKVAKFCLLTIGM